MTSKHGGRRPNQTGRRPHPETRKRRMGVLYLSPVAIATLDAQARAGERWQDTINRLLEQQTQEERTP